MLKEREQCESLGKILKMKGKRESFERFNLLKDLLKENL